MLKTTSPPGQVLDVSDLSGVTPSDSAQVAHRVDDSSRAEIGDHSVITEIVLDKILKVNLKFYGKHKIGSEGI